MSGTSKTVPTSASPVETHLFVWNSVIRCQLVPALSRQPQSVNQISVPAGNGLNTTNEKRSSTLVLAGPPLTPTMAMLPGSRLVLP